MAKNIGVRLQFVDAYSKPLKEAQERIKKSTSEIREQAKRVAELRMQVKNYEEIKKLSSKEDIADAKLKNKQIRDQIKLIDAETAEIRERMRVEKQGERELQKLRGDSLKQHQKHIDTLKKVAKYAKAAVLAAAGTAVAGGVKTGIGAAAELETLRANIETVTKSPARASEVMKHAVHLANRSAFDNAELIEAAAALETYGLDTEKYLTSIGDAAAINNRDVADMARAFGKAAVSGQFDSLADIGITRDTLNTFAKSKGISLFDGTKIKDTKQFADTLKMFMDSRYTGGMEKQSDTLTGMWSTIKGIGRSGLGLIAGVKADGKIIDGSIFAILKEKLDSVRNTLTRWEEEGVFQKFANAMDPAIERAKELASDLERTASIARTFAEEMKPIWEWTKWVGKGTNSARKWVEDIPFEFFDALKEGRPMELNIDTSSVKSWWRQAPAYASGTSYHPGGTAIVGERGPEMVNLPRGSSVRTASQTRSILRGGNTVNIYIDGARRSDDEMANTVARKLLEALDNV